MHGASCSSYCPDEDQIILLTQSWVFDFYSDKRKGCYFGKATYTNFG